MTQTPTITTLTIDLVRDDELLLHAQDERCYGAIRNGKLMSNLTWNELTPDEQAAARSNLFYNQYYY